MIDLPLVQKSGRSALAMTTANSRSADHPIEAIFLERWSPRAFTGEAISDADLRTIFEAARWAPSSFNSQPWRFFYAKRDTAAFATFLGLLTPSNQVWAKNASALMIVASQKNFMPPGKSEPVESRSHSFDTGAAWGYLALQTLHLGHAAHAMAGFDAARAHKELNMPEDYRPEAAIAIGRVGDKANLPDALRAREQPNGRNPQTEFVFEGGFHAS
jgi:nitroreductase